jgi:signal transduction histidine kinase
VRGKARVIQFPRSRDPDARAQLELLEFLVSSEDATACAQRMLDWIARTVGIEQTLVLVADVESERLVPVASTGISSVSAGEYSLALEDRAHPLVAAMFQRDTVYFARNARQPHTPLESTAFHVMPLRSDITPEGIAAGLLLASSNGAAFDAEVHWAAEILGEKLQRLRSREQLASSRVGRERTLLLGIINAVTDPILLTNTEGKLVLSNARAEKLFTAPEDASEGRRRAVALNNMLFSAALASSTMGHETTRRELVLVDPIDGTDLLFELLATPAVDPWSESTVISILRNVTDLGRASAQLEENYRLLRTAEADVRAERHRIELVMDSVADPIVVTDPHGDIVMLNDKAERLFTVREGASEEVQRLVRTNDAHFTSFASNLLFASGDRHRGEILLRDPADGAPMPVEAVAGTVLSETGELTWVVTILHDRREAIENARLYEQLKEGSAQLEVKVQEATTELVKQNELLRRQAIELEQASQMKTQFLANVSHELRTPLNAILGYTSMIIQGVTGEASAPQKRALTRVDSNARHLLTIINEILDITRIEAGKMPVHVAEFELPTLLSEVMAELEPIIARSKLKVSSHVSGRLPKLRSDRQKVKQIVLNLLGNALKFTPQGSVDVTATFESDEQVVRIAVADTGIGIASEHHEKVFEDFRQVDNSPTRQYGGTGLGLSICRRLAMMLDGTITLASSVGIGSTFTLALPMKSRKR